MSNRPAGTAGKAPAAVAEDGDEELRTANLKRLDPDSILADEADPDALLGHESDSEGTDSRRNSRHLKEGTALNGGDGKAEASDGVSTAATPTQLTSSSDASKKAVMSEAELRAQLSDLQNQVTGLNNKLVSSFMRVSDLEDEVSESQNSIATFTSKVAALEKEREEHLAALNTGLLVEKAHVSQEMQRMMDRVLEETTQRGKAISDKEKIEAELDELSSSLFSEANKMVAVERLSRARAEEKSRSMEERLKDTEEIMEHQQKRLAELQAEVERRRANDDDDPEANGAQHAGGTSNSKTRERSRQVSSGGVPTGLIQLPPLSHNAHALLPLLEQELMLDIVPYAELRAFLNHLRRLRQQLAPFYTYPLPGASSSSAVHGRSQPNSPVPSRTSTPGPAPEGGKQVVYAGMNPAYAPTNNRAGGESSPRQASGVHLVSPFLAAGVSRHRDYPSLPSNCEQLVHLPSQVSTLPFLKRSVEEDSDPCLRLDFAPGLNWLSRRQMQNALLDGQLVVEPIFAGATTIDEGELRLKYSSMPPAACSMCGKAVLGVPLPGDKTETGPTSTTSNWISAANSAASSLQAAVASSSGGLVSPSHTSAPSTSLGTSAASSSSSSTVTSTNLTASSTPLEAPRVVQKQRSGLFSSLRSSMGGSPRPSFSGASNSSTSSITGGTGLFSSADGVATADHDGGAGSSGAQGLVDEDLFAPQFQPPVIPTHIFRISEASSTRYLLCPQHCLRRLRAACAFWGYVRNLERAVVLEGKLAWDDMLKREKAKGKEEEAEKGRASNGDETPRVPIVEEEEKEEKTAPISEEKLDEHGAEVTQEAVPSTSEEISDESVVERNGTNAEDTEEKEESVSKRNSGLSVEEDEEGFADAISTHSSPVIKKSLEEGNDADVNGIEKLDGDEVNKKADTKGADESNAVSKDSTDAATDEVMNEAVKEEAKEEVKGEGEQPEAVSQAPPVVPPRRANASPAPPLPPRTKRPPPALPARSTSTEVVPPSSLASQRTHTDTQVQRPPPRKTLPMKGGKSGRDQQQAEEENQSWTWEEKVWCEVTRLKAEMWLARIGVTEQAESEPVQIPAEPSGTVGSIEEVVHEKPPHERLDEEQKVDE